MIGQTFGHYRILEKLGAGGMGEVYLAEDSTLKRKVALKVLPAELASDQERLERFQREAESLAALNHPNIVHVYSVEEDQGFHYLTMELVEGEDLGQLISQEGLSVEEFLSLAVTLADALSEAHDRGVIHRDLKPANVMIDRRGRPKILDFGLAKLRHSEATEDLSQLPTDLMTQAGSVLGTYPYMSPEQAEGKEVDHRSDIFSLGTMLYEMATGERPFKGDTPASLISSILRDSPPAVDLAKEELPHHLGRIVSRCLEKDPEDRYQRARDLKRDLEELRREVQGGESVATHPTPRQEPGRKSLLLAGAGVAILLVAVFAAYWLWPSGPPITSLAVLPLENLTGDPEQEYFASGMTEGLIADLGQVAALRVISRQSVMRFKGSNLSLPEIAQQLDVEALIAGSVLAAGDRVRISAQLIQAEPEQQLWSNSYDRPARDVLALLSDVSRAIVGEVRVAVSADEQARLEQTAPVDPEAHRAYLRSLGAWSSINLESSLKAVEHLQRAVAIEPGFADAWAELSALYFFQVVALLPPNMEAERAATRREMDIALEKALALNPLSSRAHMVQAWIHHHLEWDWARAESEFLLSLEANPSNGEARGEYANLLVATGRTQEGLAEAARAEALDPLSSLTLSTLGWTYFWAHKFETSVAYHDRALELRPAAVDILGGKGYALIALGRDEEAVKTFQRMHGLMGNHLLAAALEGLSVKEAWQVLLDLVLGMDPSAVWPVGAAEGFAYIGDHDKALDWLEKGFDTRDDPGKAAGWNFVYLKVHPVLQDLLDDPRFQDLLERMNLAG
jgi:serine/threonine-protein kinase